MDDKEKIDRIIGKLESGYETNFSLMDKESIILDMNYLINLSLDLIKNNEELRINNKTIRENNRNLCIENKELKERLI